MKILHHRHTWLILAFLAGILSISSCRKKEKPKTCTMEFRIITIDVRDSTGKMVIPESYDAIILSSGEDITYRGQGDTASVVLVTDNHVKKFDDKGQKVRLTVVQNSIPSWKDFKVGSDGCHVTLMEGEPILIVR